MGASITFAGEGLIAQKQGLGEPLEVVRFVLANIPGLDTGKPVDRQEALPAAELIVFDGGVTQQAYLSPNQVVYSLSLGSDVGDWDFNWIGLVSSEGMLFAVAYVPLQQKRREIPPLQTGNNLTRNFMVVFDGAQSITGVSIPAETWQYDASAKFSGIEASVAYIQASLETIEASMAAVEDSANARVIRSGDTMTGPLMLSGDPTEPLHAVPKSFVEQHVSTSLATELNNYLASVHAAVISL